MRAFQEQGSCVYRHLYSSSSVCHATVRPQESCQRRLEAQIKRRILPEHRTRTALKRLQEESVPLGTEETVGTERRVWRIPGTNYGDLTKLPRLW